MNEYTHMKRAKQSTSGHQRDKVPVPSDTKASELLCEAKIKPF